VSRTLSVSVRGLPPLTLEEGPGDAPGSTRLRVAFELDGRPHEDTLTFTSGITANRRWVVLHHALTWLRLPPALRRRARTGGKLRRLWRRLTDAERREAHAHAEASRRAHCDVRDLGLDLDQPWPSPTPAEVA
jgi:hypothetical protein